MDLEKLLHNKKNVKISSKEKINLLEQLSSLLKSWIPLINCFKIIVYQTKSKKIKEILEEIINKLNKWDNLESAFKNYPNIFWTFDLSLINMWEITGKLWESIENIKIKEEKNKELKSKIVAALIYPSVVISLSITMICIFMIYVIPKIEDMYRDAKVNLPDLTNNVIKASRFLQDNYIYIILLLIIIIFCIHIFKTHNKTKIYWDKFILRIPIFWVLLKKKIIAQFTRNLWTLLKNWVIINKSLDITSISLENDAYEKKIKEINSRVSKWIELSHLMWINEIKNWKENFYFPIELSSVVKIWEETGKMADLLLRLSIKNTKEIDSIVKNVQTTIEPLVIVIVWLVIWTLIMAIMLPFFNMVNVI